GLSVAEILKYLSYLFIWPGVTPAKYVYLMIIFSPFIMCFSLLRDRFDKELFREVCYWLGLSVVCIVGICLASHQDPRYFRFLLGVYIMERSFLWIMC